MHKAVGKGTSGPILLPDVTQELRQQLELELRSSSVLLPVCELQ